MHSRRVPDLYLGASPPVEWECSIFFPTFTGPLQESLTTNKSLQVDCTPQCSLDIKYSSLYVYGALRPFFLVTFILVLARFDIRATPTSSPDRRVHPFELSLRRSVFILFSRILIHIGYDRDIRFSNLPVHLEYFILFENSLVSFFSPVHDVFMCLPRDFPYALTLFVVTGRPVSTNYRQTNSSSTQVLFLAQLTAAELLRAASELL